MSSRLATGAVALTLLLVATACGNASDGSSDGSADSTEGKAGLARAEKFVEDNSVPPTDLGLTPLSKKPETGILFVTLENPIPTAVTKDDGTQAAAEALGWTYKRVTVGAGPEGPAKAMQQAIAMGPQYIGYSGTPSAALREGLAEAKDAGISIVADALAEPMEDPLLPNGINGPGDVEFNAKALANYAIAQTKGKAHILVVDIPAFPILGVFTKAIEATVKENCPGCKVTVIDTQISDIGTKNPAAVVSAVQKDPSINYAYFGFGDIALGVPAALKAAGLEDKLKIGGETPAAGNLQALKTGSEEVWMGLALGVLGWRCADVAARHSVGDDPADVVDALLPTQLLTKDNIGDTALDDTGAYIGIENYQDEFKKLWLVE